MLSSYVLMMMMMMMIVVVLLMPEEPHACAVRETQFSMLRLLIQKEANEAQH